MKPDQWGQQALILVAHQHLVIGIGDVGNIARPAIDDMNRGQMARAVVVIGRGIVGAAVDIRLAGYGEVKELIKYRIPLIVKFHCDFNNLTNQFTMFH